jgi:hypothetical protein
VVRIGQTFRAGVDRAHDLLSLYGLNVFGVVANGFDLHQQPEYGFAAVSTQDTPVVESAHRRKMSESESSILLKES